MNYKDDPTPGLRWAYVRRLEKLSPADLRAELEMLRIAVHATLPGVDILVWEKRKTDVLG